MNSIFIFLLEDKNNSNSFHQCKKELSNGFECLNIASNINNDEDGLTRFVKEVIYLMPGIETQENKILIKIIDEILKEMEVEEEFLKKLQNLLKNKKGETFIKTFNETHRRQITNSNKRRFSVDNFETSMEKEKDETKEKNHKIEKYFQPKGKDLKNLSLNLTKKNLNSQFNQFSNSNTNSNHNSNFNNNFNNNNFNLNDSINLNSEISYTTFGEQLKQSPSYSENLILLSKKDSGIEIFPNSNNLGENSFYSKSEFSMKRPMNIFQGNSDRINFSSVKSISNSQISSGAITEFSFNPNIPSTSKSSHSKSILYELDPNKSFKTRLSNGGINSILANQHIHIHKSKKNRLTKNLSNKKKKIDLVEKIKQKCGNLIPIETSDINSIYSNDSNLKYTLQSQTGSNNNSKMIEVNESKGKQNLKNFINFNFYNKINKSPDVKDQKYKDQKIVTLDNKFLTQKRKGENIKNDEKYLKTKSTQGSSTIRNTNRNKSRSRSVSCTDDEILVYQTPVKIEKFSSKNMNNPKNQNGSPSPGATTRKNLFNLFKQIDKSG